MYTATRIIAFTYCRHAVILVLFFMKIYNIPHSTETKRMSVVFRIVLKIFTFYQSCNAL